MGKRHLLLEIARRTTRRTTTTAQAQRMLADEFAAYSERVRNIENTAEAVRGRFLRAANSYRDSYHRAQSRYVILHDLRQPGRPPIRWAALDRAGVRTLEDLDGHTVQSLCRHYGVGEVSAREVLRLAVPEWRRIEAMPIPRPRPDGQDAMSLRLLWAAAAALLFDDAFDSDLALVRASRDRLGVEVAEACRSSAALRAVHRDAVAAFELRCHALLRRIRDAGASERIRRAEATCWTTMTHSGEGSHLPPMQDASLYGHCLGLIGTVFYLESHRRPSQH